MSTKIKQLVEQLIEANRFATMDELRSVVAQGGHITNWKNCGGNELKVWVHEAKDGFYVRDTIATRGFLAQYTVYDVVKTAQSNTSSKPTPSTLKKETPMSATSKMQKAASLFDKKLPRADMIALLTKKAQLTPAGAATYYQKLKGFTPAQLKKAAEGETNRAAPAKKAAPKATKSGSTKKPAKTVVAVKKKPARKTAAKKTAPEVISADGSDNTEA